MKRGRRPAVRRIRARHRAIREEQARAHTDEHIISIEIMTIGFASLRESPTWQVLGWWGRWLNMWRKIGRPGSTSALDTLAAIYKRRYSFSGIRLEWEER